MSFVSHAALTIQGFWVCFPFSIRYSCDPHVGSRCEFTDWLHLESPGNHFEREVSWVPALEILLQQIWE